MAACGAKHRRVSRQLAHLHRGRLAAFPTGGRSLRWVADAAAVADLIRETLANGDGGRA